MVKTKSGQKTYAVLLLRAGLALIFLYAAISSFKTPNDWIGYLPSFLRKMDNVDTILRLFSFYELALALWLISGKYVKYAALVAAVTLFGIVLANFKLFAITFRDMAIIFSALALFVLTKDD